MMDKIEWYREVLELEPSSKLFFPLARLLVEDGQPEAALETLRRGLERHPEFLEARLFYIEQLYHHGQPEACVAEVTELGQLFASYPGFWQAWAASMLGSGCGDVATALRFLAASFASRPLNLNEVFERGLRSFMQEAQSSDLPRGKALADLAVMGPEDMDAQAHDAFSSPAAKPAGAGMAEGDDAASFAAAQGRREHSLPQPTPDRPLSLRTRSMAEILAEQGDLRGAIDIYEELAGAALPEDLPAIYRRLDSLRAALGGASVSLSTSHAGISPVAASATASSSFTSAVVPAHASGPDAMSGGSSVQVRAVDASSSRGILDMLEKLAVRLENRAR